jgi:hypothetical protein
MAKISAPSWTTHGYSCRREREILAELAEEQANWLNEHPDSTEMFRCGTSLVSVARDLFIKEVLAVEISRREKQLENLEKPWDEHWQKRETLAVYVEFLKSSLDENIHPDRSLRSCTGESFGFSSRNVGPNFSVPSILHLFRKVWSHLLSRSGALGRRKAFRQDISAVAPKLRF